MSHRNESHPVVGEDLLLVPLGVQASGPESRLFTGSDITGVGEFRVHFSRKKGLHDGSSKGKGTPVDIFLSQVQA